jgi:hypothetical protein
MMLVTVLYSLTVNLLDVIYRHLCCVSRSDQFCYLIPDYFSPVVQVFHPSSLFCREIFGRLPPSKSKLIFLPKRVQISRIQGESCIVVVCDLLVVVVVVGLLLLLARWRCTGWRAIRRIEALIVLKF